MTLTCGLLTNPKGKLIVTGAATKDAAKADAVLEPRRRDHRL